MLDLSDIKYFSKYKCFNWLSRNHGLPAAEKNLCSSFFLAHLRLSRQDTCTIHLCQAAFDINILVHKACASKWDLEEAIQVTHNKANRKINAAARDEYSTSKVHMFDLAPYAAVLIEETGSRRLITFLLLWRENHSKDNL